MTDISTANKQHDAAALSLKLVRDSIIGEPAIKAEVNQQIYLPHPCEDEANPAASDAKYTRYINGAEFDDIPSNTLSSILGAMFNPEPTTKLPPKLSYLEDDADGDGLRLNELMKIAASELLQMEYVGLMAEFSDLAGLNIDDISVADAKSLDLKSSIKMYVRESIINWGFEVINGKKQLKFVVLAEVGSTFDAVNYQQMEVKSYLLLALNGEGEYFQKKYTTKSQGKGFDESEEFYPLAKSERLDFIPFEFVLASELPKGVIPLKPGYIYPISSKTLHRYGVSADLKESMFFAAAPSSWSKGWTKQGHELFKTMTGRDFISVNPAAHNPLPKDAEIGILNWDSEGSAFFKYMENNAGEIRALGGVFDNTDGVDQETATAATIKAADKKGVLSTVSDNIEQSVARVIGYCGLFMGAVGDANIKLNRDYDRSKMSTTEQKEVRDNYTMGLISRNEALRQFEKGGVLTKTAEEITLEATLTGDE